MAHDVCVSYSSKDKTIADAVVAGLEDNDIRCWIAPRDITPGISRSEAIVGAIEACKVMVVILSKNSNESRLVLREVDRAVANEVIIIPFRIQNIEPTGAMAYLLSTEHWLDAITPPMKRHIQELANTIEIFLSGGVPPQKTRNSFRRWMVLGSLTFVAFSTIIFLVAWANGRDPLRILGIAGQTATATQAPTIVKTHTITVTETPTPTQTLVITPSPEITSTPRLITEGLICDQALPFDPSIPGYIDFLRFTARIVDGNLEVTYYLRDLPEQLEINFLEKSGCEYEWWISINVDGSAKNGIGHEYALRFAHNSNGGPAELAPIEIFESKIYQQKSKGQWYSVDTAQPRIDYEAKTITLSGYIPGFNENCYIIAQAYISGGFKKSVCKPEDITILGTQSEAP